MFFFSFFCFASFFFIWENQFHLLLFFSRSFGWPVDRSFIRSVDTAFKLHYSIAACLPRLCSIIKIKENGYIRLNGKLYLGQILPILKSTYRRAKIALIIMVEKGSEGIT